MVPIAKAFDLACEDRLLSKARRDQGFSFQNTSPAFMDAFDIRGSIGKGEAIGAEKSLSRLKLVLCATCR